MKPCEVCGKECRGRTCSGACRAKLSRRTRTQAHAHGTAIQKALLCDAHREIEYGGSMTIPETAPCTQNTDAQEPAQSTKSDEEVWELQEDYDIARLELAGLDRHEKAIVEEGKHRDALAYYYAHLDKYVARREPEKLNWGKWLNSKELKQAGFKANRVSIPGDWDYEGVAVFIPGTPLSAHLPADAAQAAPVNEVSTEAIR